MRVAELVCKQVQEGSYTVTLTERDESTTMQRVFGPYGGVVVAGRPDVLGELEQVTRERDAALLELDELQAGYDAIEEELTELRIPRNRRLIRSERF